MTDDLHRDVSRMIVGVILFHDRVNTKADVRLTADKVATEVLELIEPAIRADERERVHHWSHKCRFCDVTHHYDDYVGERRAHQRTTGMAPSMGWTCVCGRWVDRIEDWHNHLTGTGETQGEP